jgi:hypothetical protein
MFFGIPVESSETYEIVLSENCTNEIHGTFEIVPTKYMFLF